MRFFAAIFLFIASLAGSAQTVVVSKQRKIVNLANVSFYLEDPAGKYTIREIIQKDAASDLRRLTRPVINFGVTGSAFWIKSIVRNETNEKLVLELGNPSLTDIQLYEIDASGLRAQQRSGNWHPFPRPINDVDYRFELAVQPQTTETLFLRVLHYRGTQFPLVIGTKTAFYEQSSSRNLLRGMYYGFMLLMVLYNLFIYFTLKDDAYLYYVLYIFFMGFWNACTNGYAFKYFWPSEPYLNQYIDVITAILGIASILFSIHFLNTNKHTPFFHRIFQALLLCYGITIVVIFLGNFLTGSFLLEIISLLVVIFLFITAIIVLRKGYKPAGFFLLAWSFLLLSVVVYILKDFNILPYTGLTKNALQIGSAAEALLLSMALANRINIYKKEKEQANHERLHSLEENRRLILEQNILLEGKVEERTRELKKTNKELVSALENLKATQAQLIQTEKMASLGELAAGIAHEIQNPLNFINNFSEVNSELLSDLRKGPLQKLPEEEKQEINNILDDFSQNLLRISYHGQRADAIVKSMLYHSRKSTGQKEPTDINALVDQYLHISYNGWRAKDKSFVASLHTDFDAIVDKINVIPQDIGRVLLNLFNNAFYSVNEKQRMENGTFKPAVSVATKKQNKNIEIHIRDNGLGIPLNVLHKIYQPFFTTKPAGEGIGLGLSLSYDIITKEHGGRMSVNTREGEYAEFVVVLPFEEMLGYLTENNEGV
ncbi:MAG: ATP-binding protein [Bacteroidota bacterium]|nr:ATP-binding protein [Bacteroidota bacterium]